MKLEFIPWTANIEVQLVDDDDHIVDRFYVRNQEMTWNLDGIDARSLAHVIEDSLGGPEIGGKFAEHHPYWMERKMKRAAR